MTMFVSMYVDVDVDVDVDDTPKRFLVCCRQRTPTCKTRKGFFIGYMTHRLLHCSLGRAEEDDRDHFANKRLDLAGPLIGGLFRTLFYRLTQEMRKHLQKVSVPLWHFLRAHSGSRVARPHAHAHAHACCHSVGIPLTCFRWCACLPSPYSFTPVCSCSA